MRKSDLAEKENIPVNTEVISGDESYQPVPSWASILKPTRKPNLNEFSPNPNVVTKSSSKVSLLQITISVNLTAVQCFRQGDYFC